MAQQNDDDLLVEKINQLYISFRTRYVLSLPGGSMFTPKRKDDQYSKLTNGVLRNHLNHKYAVAIYAGPKSSKFVCFDVDDGKTESVAMIVDCLNELGIPRQKIYVSYSGGKGYHVELFFDDLIYTNVLRGLYNMVMERTGSDFRKIEFRPTCGNAIKLPLSVHSKTGNVCWFVDRETLRPIERQDYLLEIEQLPAAQVNQIVPKEYKVRPAKVRSIANVNAQSDIKVTSDDELLSETGTRHNHMRKIAVYLRQAGYSRSQCEDALKAWYAKQDLSLIRSDRNEVMADIDSLLNWVFSEHFKLNSHFRNRRFALTASDARLVLSVQSRSQRRILFLLLSCSASREKAISLAEIAEITGFSRKTVSATIARLKSAEKINCLSGGRYLTPEGHYGSMRNQYVVPREAEPLRGARVTFTPLEIKTSFDDSYRRCLSMLPESDIMSRFSSVEMTEYHGVQMTNKGEDTLYIDQCAIAHTLKHESFGELQVYDYNGERLYPLVDILKCMGIKNLKDAVNRHSARQIWYTMIGTRKVKKSFVNECYLALMLKRSRCPYKERLAHWQLDEE